MPFPVFYSGLMGALALFFIYLQTRSYRDNEWRAVRDIRTLVIVPARGRELTLGENLESLKNQTYKNYDIVAVVDSEGDPAVPELDAHRIKHIIADKMKGRGSGKSNAIATALNKFRNYDAYVIADTDITAPKNWLSLLIAPLSDKQIGASTTFPIFKPMSGFWSSAKCVWGLVGQGMMESEYLRFGWGGSLAFRKSLVNRKFLEHFINSVSDDVAITKEVRTKGMRMAYVSSARPIVNSSENVWTFWEWANRQTALSISGDNRVFWSGLLFYFAELLLPISGIILGITYNPALFLLIVPYAIGILRSSTRLGDISCRGFILISAIMPAILLVNLLVAKEMQEIKWRGRIYKLKWTSS